MLNPTSASILLQILESLAGPAEQALLGLLAHHLNIPLPSQTGASAVKAAVPEVLTTPNLPHPPQTFPTGPLPAPDPPVVPPNPIVEGASA
jgi:hypothetical protein